MGDDFKPDWRSPPGETITEMMERNDLDRRGLAHRLCCHPAIVDKLLTGAMPLTPVYAFLLAHHLGGSKDFWLKREEHYREPLDDLPVPQGFHCVRCQGSGIYCPDCGDYACGCPPDCRPRSVTCTHDRHALKPLQAPRRFLTMWELPAEVLQKVGRRFCQDWCEHAKGFVATTFDPARVVYQPKAHTSRDVTWRLALLTGMAVYSESPSGRWLNGWRKCHTDSFWAYYALELAPVEAPHQVPGDA